MTTPPTAYPTFDRAGKYRLGPLLGVGGMAEVHRGWIMGSSDVARLVAIKRILPGLLDGHPQAREMFENEARLSSYLHHANIVQLIDFDVDVEGRLFQVMEFVAGVDLERLVSTVPAMGPLPIPVASYVMGQVLRALDHAYHAPHPTTGKPLTVVHRDCTPSNVMLSWDGDVKVADFGVAKAVQATQATSSGRLVGKPRYMSPEQVHGQPLDGRSDIFAVGVMLWELLTGRVLFGGETVTEILAQVIQYTQHLRLLEPPHEINPSVPRSLSTVVFHLLAVERDQRPPDAAAAYAMLRSCPDIRMADAPELADVLAQRFPERAPRRRTTASHEFRGPVTQQAMGAATRSLSAGVTPMSGQVTTGAAPRGSKIALAAAAGLLALVGAVVVALVASDEPARDTAGAATGDTTPAGAAADAAPAMPVLADAAVPAIAPSDAGPPPGAEVPGAATATQPDAGAADKTKKRPRPPRPRGQIKEVELGGE